MTLSHVLLIGAIFRGAFAATSEVVSTSVSTSVQDAAVLLAAGSSCADVQPLKDFESLPEATDFCSILLSITPATTTATLTTILPAVTFTATELRDTDPQAALISRRTTSVTATVTSTRTVTGLLDVRSPAAQPTLPAKRMITVGVSVNIFDDGATNTISTPPTSLVPSLVSMCSCLSLTIPTVTTTVVVGRSAPIVTVFSLGPATVTSISTATATSTFYPVPDQCNNAGVQFGGFRYPFGQGPPYTIDAQFVRDRRAIDNFLGSGVTTVPIGYSFTADPCPADSPGLPYGPITRSCDAYTYDHRGYFYAPITGNYTFTMRVVDDIALLWLGDVAYQNFTRASATLEAQTQGPNGTGSITVQLNARSYVPLRLMMSNVGGPTHGSFDIVAPGGVRVVDSQITRAKNPYLVQFGCNRDPAAVPFVNQVNANY